MQHRAKVLVVAGSDSSGLAGIQRDNQSVLALGCHPLNVLTACTAQNASGVQSINPCSAAVFENQLNAVDSSDLSAIKVGLLCSGEQVKIFVAFLRNLACKPPLVFDPVLSASSGDTLQSEDTVDTFINDLLPLCDLLTPNVNEASQLCGVTIKSAEDVKKVADILRGIGVKNVLIKGGHFNNTDASCSDYFRPEQRKKSGFWLTSARLTTKNTRGTGCTLASAITSALALGFSMEDAQVIGKMAINQGLRNGYGLLKQAGPTLLKAFPSGEIDLPRLSYGLQEENISSNFPSLHLPNGDEKPMGLYPVVDSLEWLQRLLLCGVSTIQLRIKKADSVELETQVKQAVALSKQFNCRLFINDYWQLAIKHKAYGVHLGQEDLDEAGINEIYQAGLRLGISTHCHYEVARATNYKPSYIAFGPVFHTDTKIMPWIPRGIEGFNYWRKLLDYPLVAIGGIKGEHIAELSSKGADGIAMITGITQAASPEKTASEFMQLFDKNYQAGFSKVE